MENKLKKGHCVAVSPRLVVTSLHGGIEIGAPFIIVSKSGVERIGIVDISVFELRKVDVALVRLIDGEALFQHWIQILDRAPDVLEKAVVAYLRGRILEDDAPPYDFDAQSTQIFGVESATTLCRAQYYTTDGMSGCPVLSDILPDGSRRLIGVHVASDDATEVVCRIKKRKNGDIDAVSVSSGSSTHSRNIHGRTAYSMICIVQNVPQIVELIRQDIPVASWRSTCALS